MDPNKRARILDKVQSGRATRAERLWLKQEGLCFYCWTSLEHDVTKEHLDSKCNGGSNEHRNLRAAHMRCNGIVGSLPVELKLMLHEIGRDKGPDAFWVKAREYQQRFGTEKKAYSRKGSGGFKLAPHRVKPCLETVQQAHAVEQERQQRQHQLGGSRVLSRADKMRLIEQAELEEPDRQNTVTFAEFWGLFEREGLEGLCKLRGRKRLAG